MGIFRSLRPRTLFNPISRIALATFAWNHRHEILRWGRTMYEQVIGRQDVSPARAVRTGTLLYAIASDHALRDAKQLRKVTFDGTEVDLDVEESWRHLPRLLERIEDVKGVRRIKVNGRQVFPAVATVGRRVVAR